MPGIKDRQESRSGEIGAEAGSTPDAHGPPIEVGGEDELRENSS